MPELSVIKSNILKFIIDAPSTIDTNCEVVHHLRALSTDLPIRLELKSGFNDKAILVEDNNEDESEDYPEIFTGRIGSRRKFLRRVNKS